MAGLVIGAPSNLSSFIRASYLARLGLDKERVEPSLPFLRRVLRAHLSSIPFENLDAPLGRPIRMDTQSVMDKLVHTGRGGYCFEHNALMRAFLEDVGFACVRSIMGRVLWASPNRNERTHMANLIEAENRRWLVDVGFGGSGCCEPLDLDRRDPQETPLGVYRVQEVELHPGWKEYTVATLHRKKPKPGEAAQEPTWRTLYVFDMQPQEYVDCEMANYFIYSKSPFRSILNCSLQLPAERKRVTVLNNVVSVYVQKEGSEAVELEERITANDPDQLYELLQERVNIKFPTNGPFAVSKVEFAKVMREINAFSTSSSNV